MRFETSQANKDRNHMQRFTTGELERLDREVGATGRVERRRFTRSDLIRRALDQYFASPAHARRRLTPRTR